MSRCARRDFPIPRLTSDQHDSTVAGLHLLPAPHQQRDLFLRTCGHSPARMLLTTRNLARLRELYKNLAISQRELDQAASDQQTAKAICGRRCQQEAPTPAPVVGATHHHPSPLSKCHSRSQPPLAIGREQSRDLPDDLPDDAKKACYPDCGGSPCGRGATDRVANQSSRSNGGLTTFDCL